MGASPVLRTVVSAMKPEPGQRLLVTFKNGARLLALTVILHALSSVYNGLFWMLPPLFYLGIGWALVYCGMYIWFGYQTRAGFWHGLLTGTVGALPGILLLALSLLTLATSGMRAGGPLWVMVPWAGPFLALGDSLPYSWFERWMVHGSVPLAVLLTGLGSWLGRPREACART